MGGAFKNERVAFEVGQDYARYGLAPADGADTAFMRGYEERRAALPRTSKADRFVRKWLQVRFNAWKRNRYVSPGFTPEFIRSIDLPRCPVSGVELTYGTGADTDWSIDRIDNDGGYAPKNVVVVSTRVNAAKGALSVSELAALQYKVPHAELIQNLLAGDRLSVLTETEWRRLSWFAATSEKCQAYPVREAFELSEKSHHLAYPWCCNVQRMLVQLTSFSAAERTEYWGFFQGCSKTSEGLSAFGLLRKSVEEYAKSTKAHLREATDAFHDDERWNLFAAWWVGLAMDGRLKPMLRQIGKTLDSSTLVTADQMRDEKQAATKGFA